MSQIEVVAIFKVKPSDSAKAAELLKACTAPSRAESTNDTYIPCRDLDADGTFVFIERWDSREALQVHMETPHFKAMASALEPLLIEPLKVHILQPV